MSAAEMSKALDTIQRLLNERDALKTENERLRTVSVLLKGGAEQGWTAARDLAAKCPSKGKATMKRANDALASLAGLTVSS